MILEKKIKFNNKDWLVTIQDNYFEVFLYNNGEINEENVFRGSTYGKTLIEQCKNIVLRANDILFPVSELEEFNKWDGNMDKLIPPKTGSGIK